MTTFIAAVRAALEVDATLIAIATGGIWDTEETGRDGLTPDMIQDADSVVIKPALFLKESTRAEFGEADATIKAERWFLEIYGYQHTGYATIAAMLDRVKTLLNRQQVQFTEPADYWCHLMLWRGRVSDQKDLSLGGASMSRDRYEVHVTRS